ncbi:YdeI/OmpD-associated family protein [Sporocytophaga myxococcoides]|uniref:YdeI/OmpD-associated family protein n=1 Tax=Sporocytophaga myxococcoides TaxID=153721 RepID=UPI0004264651|nr:YdeI/OmpD-associated family protein [Sporocytophaga myxococcoides]
MIKFNTVILQFDEKGEKTGWSYIEIPKDVAQQLQPSNKKSFKVKGKLDAYEYQGVSLLPMGNGDYIMPLNASVRKAIKKNKGAMLIVELSLDTEEKKLSEDFMTCLEDEPKALKFFQSLPKSHQRYFSNWIESAKTEATKTKRIAMSVNGLALGLGYGEMIRMYKNQ